MHRFFCFFYEQVRGKLIRRKNSEASVLPGSVRHDPHGVPAKLTQKDVARGMEDLMNRGFIPRHIDLTPAFVKMPAPVLCGELLSLHLERLCIQIMYLRLHLHITVSY